jgi:hypothetical protein
VPAHATALYESKPFQVKPDSSYAQGARGQSIGRAHHSRRNLASARGSARAAPAALRPLLVDETMRRISPFTFRDV